MIRSSAALFFLLVLCGTTRAQLAPEADKPYHLQVVLHIARHPILTDVFADQVRRELHDSLQAALGDMARVEVVADHARLKEVETKGLKHALDGWNFVGDAKIHFVLIDFANGRYELQARQYDGSAGLPSPVVRRASTADRHLVARSASLLIDKDFGLVGTITQKDDKKAEVTFKGGGLGPLEPWVKKDDIFAVSQIVDQAGTGQAAFRVPWTLLQALDDPRGGKCSCQLHHRFKDPLPDAAGVLGYRCLKLGTIRAPLRLRVVSDDKLATPLNARPVQISASGFQDEAPEKQSTNSDGLVVSVQPYQNIAFVIVFEGGEPLAKIPVEIVDERITSVSVSASVEAERRGQLLLRRARWLRRVFDAIEVASSVVKDRNATIGGSREAALKKAEAGQKGLETDIKHLTAERDSLLQEAKQAQTTLDVAEGEQHLQELQAQTKQLQRYVSNLSGIVTEEKDPKRQKWKQMAEEAKLLETAADYDQAITRYQKVFADGYDDPDLKQHLNELKRLWPVKDDQHNKAHTFIYETWPAAEHASQMKAQFSQARDAFETCKAAGDWLRLRKLYKVNVAHASRLTKEIESLRRDNEDDRKTLETIDAVSGDLKKLNEELEKYLRQAESANK